MQGVTTSVCQCAQVWNPLGIVGVITAFNFPCAVLGTVPPPWLLIARLVLVASNKRTSISICRVMFPCKSSLCHVLLISGVNSHVVDGLWVTGWNACIALVCGNCVVWWDYEYWSFFSSFQKWTLGSTILDRCRVLVDVACCIETQEKERWHSNSFGILNYCNSEADILH